MKVVWHRQALPQLRFPGLCALTGLPAEGSVRVVFRKGWAAFLPAIGRLVVNASNPPAVISVPVSAGVRSTITTWRWVALGGGLGGLLLGLLVAVVLRGTAGAALFMLLLLGGLGLAIFASVKADVFGTDVDGDWISMANAHPGFAHALVATNAPGMIVVPQPAPMVQPYPGPVPGAPGRH